MLKIFIALVMIEIIFIVCDSKTFNEPYGNSLQKIIVISIITIFIVFLVSKPISNWTYTGEKYDIYNKYLVDAIINHKTSIDIEPSQALKNLENPYDVNSREGVQYYFDTAYYKEKYYVYYGVVPAIILLVPYKLATGLYLKTEVATMIFVLLSIIINVKLTIEIYKRWFKNLPFKMLLMFIISNLIAGSYMWITWRMWVYELVIMAGLFFVQLGLLLIINATCNKEKIKYTKVFLSCLCMALAVGCRPNLVFASIIMLPFLIDILKNVGKSKIGIAIVSIVLPYLIVAVPLMVYNYTRFGSIFEFGARYQLTITNVNETVGKIADIPKGLYKYFIETVRGKKEFPYIGLDTGTKGFTSNYYNGGTVGGILFLNLTLIGLTLLPVCITETKDKILKTLLWLLPITGIIIATVTVIMAGSHHRYIIDFFYLFTIDAMIIWCIIYEKIPAKKTVFVLIVFLILASLFINFCATYLSSEYDFLKNLAPKTYEFWRELMTFKKR